MTNIGTSNSTPTDAAEPEVTNNDTNDFRPSFSRDGKKIVYEGIDPTGGDSEIYTINATTGQTPDNDTNNDTNDHDPDYAPNGARIAYRGWDGHDWEIYTIHETGGTPVHFTDNETQDWNPDYEPEDGTYIAYQGRELGRAEADYEIHVVRRRGGFEGEPFHTPVQITYNDRLDADPSYSPNGPHIVYTGNDGNDLEIYRINRGSGHVLKLTSNSAPEVTHDINPSWGRPPHPPVLPWDPGQPDPCPPPGEGDCP